jgi:hypothetical protein
MSKQTSVDFLIEKFSAILGKVNFTSIQGLLMKDAVEEARDMHEVEIMRAFYDGNPTCYQDKDGQQYYNETYKKEEKWF